MVLVVDADLLPNTNLRYTFHNYAIKNKLYSSINRTEPQRSDGALKNVYVIPTFEFSGPYSETPLTISKLYHNYYVTKKAHAFHHWCKGCYGVTNHTLFLNQSIENDFHILQLYEVLWKNAYEPFHISESTVPLYAEEFKGYGFNKASQVTITFLHPLGIR